MTRTTLTHCPICCGSIDTLFIKDGFPIIRCRDCDFLSVGQYPTEHEISAHYLNSYRQATETYYPKDRSRRWRAFWRAAGLAPWIYRKSVLDLGCGGGHMAQALSRIAKSVHGNDISQNSIAFARKHFRKPTFSTLSLDELAKSGMTFDFVFSSEVIEHLPGPHAFMQAITAVTKMNGVVHLTAPQAGHAQTPATLESWSDICPPEHLQWFSRENLALLFSQYGFTEIRRHKTRSPAHCVFFQKTSSIDLKSMRTIQNTVSSGTTPDLSNIVLYAAQTARLLLPYTAPGMQFKNERENRNSATLGSHSLWLVNDAITDLKDIIEILNFARENKEKPNFQIVIDRMRDTLSHVEKDPLFKRHNFEQLQKITKICISDLEKISKG